MGKRKELICPGCKKVIGIFNEELVKNTQGLTWHPKCYEDYCNKKEAEGK